MLNWLTARDADGNAHAIARRLGVNMIIWMNRIWESRPRARTWQRNEPSCPDLPRAGLSKAVKARCHLDHMHIEVGLPGAHRQTGWWRTAEHR